MGLKLGKGGDTWGEGGEEMMHALQEECSLSPHCGAWYDPEQQVGI